MPARDYATMRSATQRSDLAALGRYMLPLMLRNLSSDGFVFTDPADPNRFSAPGCIIASPSFERDLAIVNQDYVYNWTRDAAVVATEIALADMPVLDGAGSGPLSDYVSFAGTCQANAPTLGRACYTIEGQPREWTDQNDGPALQSLAVLQAFPQLNAAAQQTARALVQRNLDYLLAEYRNPSYNLWEETRGQSFFTRSVQLRCLVEHRDNGLGFAVPPGTGEAIDWLRQALQSHWNGGYHVSILEPEDPRDRYDPNIDIVMASIYGALDCTDPQLLATAAMLRRQWADPASPLAYPVNQVDAAAGLGPLLGRYPGDTYDGDTADHNTDGHPWALCTANFAQLYYEIAAAVESIGRVTVEGLSAEFFTQVGVMPDTGAADAAQRLRDAGDSMLRAIVHHSDHLELSEQFDSTTGYEKSVRNLTWSYAAFLSAVRARGAARSAAVAP